MLKFTKPEIINGEQLIKELADAGIVVNSLPIVDGEGLLNLDCDAKFQIKIQELLDAHIPVFKEPTVEEKLASVGVNLEDLKAALGL